jgi:hypothetical protein
MQLTSKIGSLFCLIKKEKILNEKDIPLILLSC